jgi:4'-phosphopantetheinyl transferase EntD
MNNTCMLGGILIEGAVAEECRGELYGVSLWPEEQALMQRAIPDRRREFATTRGCARRALRRLGFEPGPLMPGVHGGPIWPNGVVGSLTHCPGYRGAAVARTNKTLALGIDAEVNMPLSDGVLEMIAGEAERSRLPSSSTVCWDRLLFSAKEAVYKAWSPLTGIWLEFEDLTLEFECGAAGFAAEVREGVGPEGSPRHFSGRWSADVGLLVAMAVPCSETSASGRPS